MTSKVYASYKDFLLSGIGLNLAGGGGSDESTVPTRVDDNLRSEDRVEVLFGMGEGSWKGLKNQSNTNYFVADTALEAADGSLNYKDASLVFHKGTPDPDPVTMFLGGTASGHTVGVNLFTNTPVTRTTTTGDIDAIDVRLRVDQLGLQTLEGESLNEELLYKIEVKPTSGATWTATPSNVGWVETIPDPTTPSAPSEGIYGSLATRVQYLQDEHGLTLVQAQTQAWAEFQANVVGPIDTINNDLTVYSENMRVYGKTSSPMIKEVRIPVARNLTDTYDIRVTKISPESTDLSAREITWDIFEQIDLEPKAYANTAMAQIMLRATDQLSSLPQMYGIWDMLEIKVPSIYDPVTRSYDFSGGPWDGSFKIEHTDDLAWIIYDLVHNDTHGIASYYPINFSKYDALDASVWWNACNEITGAYEGVPRPNGGTRPRVTFNGIIDTPRNSKELLTYMAGAGNAVFYEDASGQYHLKVEKNDSPTHLFTEMDIEGEFTYAFTNINTRYNDITVVFRNKNLPKYQEDRRRVKDQTDIDAVGSKPFTFAAVGCVDVDEAISRAGHKLITSLTETRSISFNTTRAGAYVEPHGVILISDEDMDEGVSRRCVSISGSRKVLTLHEDFVMQPLVTDYEATIQTPDGVFVSAIISGPGNPSTITLADPVPTPLRDLFSLSISSPTVGDVKAYRVLSIEENPDDPNKISISGIEVNTNKINLVDNFDGSEFDVTEPIIDTVHAVVNLTATTVTRSTVSGELKDIQLTWLAPTATTATNNYVVYHQFNDEQRVEVMRGSQNSYTLENAQIGLHKFLVSSILPSGVVSPEGKQQAVTIVTPVYVVPDVTGVTIVNPSGGIGEYTGVNPVISWDVDTSARWAGWDSDTSHPDFANYEIDIVNPSNGAVVHTYQPVDWAARQLELNYEDLNTYGLDSVRDFNVVVAVKDVNAAEGVSSSINLTKPETTLTGVAITQPEDFSSRGELTFNTVSASDHRGVRVWVSTTPDAHSTGSIVWEGTGFPVMDFTEGTNYVSYQPIDVFGTTAQAIQTATVTATISDVVGGIADLVVIYGSVASAEASAEASRIAAIDARPTTFENGGEYFVSSIVALPHSTGSATDIAGLTAGSSAEGYYLHNTLTSDNLSIWQRVPLPYIAGHRYRVEVIADTDIATGSPLFLRGCYMNGSFTINYGNSQSGAVYLSGSPTLYTWEFDFVQATYDAGARVVRAEVNLNNNSTEIQNIYSLNIIDMTVEAATLADRIQTGLDRTATGDDLINTGLHVLTTDTNVLVTRDTALVTLPFRVSNRDFFSDSILSDGNVEQAAMSGYWTNVSDANIGDSLEASSKRYLAYRELIPITSAQTWRFSYEAKVTVDTTEATAHATNAYGYFYGADKQYISGTWLVGAVHNVASGVVNPSVDFSMASMPVGTVYFKPYVYVNVNDNAGDAVVRLSELKAINVTAELATAQDAIDTALHLIGTSDNLTAVTTQIVNTIPTHFRNGGESWTTDTGTFAPFQGLESDLSASAAWDIDGANMIANEYVWCMSKGMVIVEPNRVWEMEVDVQTLDLDDIFYFLIFGRTASGSVTSTYVRKWSPTYTVADGLTTLKFTFTNDPDPDIQALAQARNPTISAIGYRDMIADGWVYFRIGGLPNYSNQTGLNDTRVSRASIKDITSEIHTQRAQASTELTALITLPEDFSEGAKYWTADGGTYAPNQNLEPDLDSSAVWDIVNVGGTNVADANNFDWILSKGHVTVKEDMAWEVTIDIETLDKDDSFEFLMYGRDAAGARVTTYVQSVPAITLLAGRTRLTFAFTNDSALTALCNARNGTNWWTYRDMVADGWLTFKLEGRANFTNRDGTNTTRVYGLSVRDITSELNARLHSDATALDAIQTDLDRTATGDNLLLTTSRATQRGLTPNGGLDTGDFTDWYDNWTASSNNPITYAASFETVYQGANNVLLADTGIKEGFRTSAVPIDVNRKYRLHVRYYHDGTAGLLYVGNYMRDVNGDVIGYRYPTGLSGIANVTAGWYEEHILIEGVGAGTEQWYANTVSAHIMILTNWNNTAVSATGIDYAYLEDVTGTVEVETMTDAFLDDNGNAIVTAPLGAGTQQYLGVGDTLWAVALQPEAFNLADGDVVTFADKGEYEVYISPLGLDPLATDEAYQLRVINKTGTGYEAELKIGTPAAAVDVTESTNATTPTGPEHLVAKVETLDASDDVYEFYISGSVDVTEFLGSYFGFGSYETWFHNGTSWVQGPTISGVSYEDVDIIPSHGSGETQNYTFTDKRIGQVNYTGTIRDNATLGTFGCSKAVGDVFITDLNSVRFTKQVVSGTRTATPNAEKASTQATPTNVVT